MSKLNINGENEKNKDGKSAFRAFLERNLGGNTLSNGLYAMIVSIIVIAAVVIVNMIVGKLELKADLTEDKLYSITEDTEKFLKNVKDDITIYYLASPSTQDTQMFELVSKYEKLADSIKVEVKDPVVYPQFVKEYDTTVEQINDNSVLVVNNDNKRFKYLDYSELIQQEFNQSSYQYEITGVDVEGMVTSAINFVTSDSDIKLCFVQGHGEQASFGTSINALLTKMNINSDTIETATAEAIPEDCSGIVIFAPTSDYTVDEVEKIKNFADTGKPLLIITGNDYEGNLVNFESLIEYYGLQKVDGFVAETNSSNCLQNYATLIIADTDASHEITSDLPRLYTVFADAKGLKHVDDLSEYIEITDIVNSSKYSYSVTDNTISVNDISEKNSIPGPFVLGAAITRKNNDVECKAAVFSSSIAFNENQLQVTQFANPDLMINTINWLCNVESSTAIAIEAKTASQAYVTVTDAQIGFWTLILVIIIPVIILVGGFVVWMTRRKR